MASDLDAPSVSGLSLSSISRVSPKGFCPGSSIVGQLLPQLIRERLRMLNVKETPGHLCQNTGPESLLLTAVLAGDNAFDALRSDSGKLETFLIVLSSSGWEDASEGDAMQEYRIFILGPDGHIMDRYEFRAPDDNAAKEHAKQMVDGHDIELWERARKIAELRSESSPLPNRRE